MSFKVGDKVRYVGFKLSDVDVYCGDNMRLDKIYEIVSVDLNEVFYRVVNEVGDHAGFSYHHFESIVD